MFYKVTCASSLPYEKEDVTQELTNEVCNSSYFVNEISEVRIGKIGKLQLGLLTSHQSPGSEKDEAELVIMHVSKAFITRGLLNSQFLWKLQKAVYCFALNCCLLHCCTVCNFLQNQPNPPQHIFHIIFCVRMSQCLLQCKDKVIITVGIDHVI